MARPITIPLTINVLHFEWQFSAAAGTLFNLNAHFGTALSLLHEKDVPLMGQHCSACLLKVNAELK
jgi:hypothetical protein